MVPVITSLVIFNILNYIPWSMIFLITQLFGVKLYLLKKREECMRIQKRVQNWCSHTTDNGKGYGYSFGYWYAASIDITTADYGDTYSIYLIATDESYRNLTKANDEKDVCNISDINGVKIAAMKKLTIFERTGSYSNPWFRRRERDAGYTSRSSQTGIIQGIIAHHKKVRHTVVYIHGPPCTGKSMIGILVANELGSSFCNTLKPWQPGDMLSTVYNEAEPTVNKPLVIVFDEIDTVIMKIHEEGIVRHNKITTAVTDKPGWNHMLDEIQRGMYPDLIVIMTSNKGPEMIDAIDKSYIRQGRVDMTFEMTDIISNKVEY
jgi:hypothetical protein